MFLNALNLNLSFHNYNKKRKIQNNLHVYLKHFTGANSCTCWGSLPRVPHVLGLALLIIIVLLEQTKNVLISGAQYFNPKYSHISLVIANRRPILVSLPRGQLIFPENSLVTWMQHSSPSTSLHLSLKSLHVPSWFLGGTRDEHRWLAHVMTSAVCLQVTEPLSQSAETLSDTVYLLRDVCSYALGKYINKSGQLLHTQVSLQ